MSELIRGHKLRDRHNNFEKTKNIKREIMGHKPLQGKVKVEQHDSTCINSGAPY